MEPGLIDEQRWTRTPDGKVVLRLIEEWKSGLTEHGDIALCFISKDGNDPAIPSGEIWRSQFICTQEDALQIARTLLRTLAFCEMERSSGFDAFRARICSPALRAVADHWNQARGKRSMPSWDDIGLDALAPHLGRVWAFDHHPTGNQFTGRLAGSLVMMGFGKTFLGVALRDLHPPPVFEAAQASFLRVISEPACVRFSGKLFRTGKRIVEGERLILPVGAASDRPAGVLGASDHDYPMPRSPIKIEVLHDIADWCKL